MHIACLLSGILFTNEKLANQSWPRLSPTFPTGSHTTDVLKIAFHTSCVALIVIRASSEPLNGESWLCKLFFWLLLTSPSSQGICIFAVITTNIRYASAHEFSHAIERYRQMAFSKPKLDEKTWRWYEGRQWRDATCEKSGGDGEEGVPVDVQRWVVSEKQFVVNLLQWDLLCAKFLVDALTTGCRGLPRHKWRFHCMTHSRAFHPIRIFVITSRPIV